MEKWQQVFLAQGMIEAEIIKGKLESNEIPVVLQYESIGMLYGVTSNTIGQVRVLVPPDRGEEALALLTEDDEDETEA